MEAGTTFLLAKEHEVIDNHLWVIISDTARFPQQVVVVVSQASHPKRTKPASSNAMNIPG